MGDNHAMKRGWGDIALAVVVIAVVAMMIVPLPRMAIDLLLAVSITSSVLVLLAAVYAPTPARLSTLPTILLVTTLFRLGLNVSTTRRILSHGDGGDVVQAFGSFVAQADLVVGLVVFAVITVVQYVVVARGAERVAEVAARFALDGLPGKQLAIDADLRAGAIDATEAGRRRGAIERQSSLYGALDGAMKFVKGDAIAAILIVVLNLAGGMIIGIGERGMDAETAARTYSILSVGDGLVMQLPALLVALAAALVVTRVAAMDGDRAIGDDIAAQLGAEPRAFFTAAALLAVLGVIPGLPHLPFLVLAAVTGGLGLWLRARPRGDTGERDLVGASSGGLAAGGDAVELVVPPAVGEALRADGAVTSVLTGVRQRLHDELGVRAPVLRVRVDTGVRAEEAELRVFGVTIEWLPAPRLAGELEARLDGALARHAHELVRAGTVQAGLDELGPGHAGLVRDVVPRIAPLPVLVEVLRRLVREGISVRDLAGVLEALALAAPGGARDAATLAEVARAHMTRVISGTVAPRGQLAAWTLDPMIEEAVRGAIVPRDSGAIIALEPDLARDIVSAVKAKVGERGVVLTSGDVRRHLKTVLDPELPGIAVVAPHELSSGVTVRSQGRIDVG